MQTVFKTVAVLTRGEARGHQLLIDDRTLDGALALLTGQTLKSFLTHNGGIQPDGTPGDRLGGEIGLLYNFARSQDGQKVVSDFSLLDSFIEHDPRAAQTISELAEKAPDQLGISLVGKFTTEDVGQPYPAMRFHQILSADLVSRPAANVALFAALAERDTRLAALEAENRELREGLALLREPAQVIAGLRTHLAATLAERDEARRFDMRLAGAPAVAGVLDQGPASGYGLPEPAASDQEKWAQYAVLCAPVTDKFGRLTAHTETPKAKAFRLAHLQQKSA